MHLKHLTPLALALALTLSAGGAVAQDKAHSTGAKKTAPAQDGGARRGEARQAEEGFDPDKRRRAIEKFREGRRREKNRDKRQSLRDKRKLRLAQNQDALQSARERDNPLAQEQRTHLDRMARIKRMRELARLGREGALLKRIAALRDEELKRHREALRDLYRSTPAPSPEAP